MRMRPSSVPKRVMGVRSKGSLMAENTEAWEAMGAVWAAGPPLRGCFLSFTLAADLSKYMYALRCDARRRLSCWIKKARSAAENSREYERVSESSAKSQSIPATPVAPSSPFLIQAGAPPPRSIAAFRSPGAACSRPMTSIRFDLPAAFGPIKTFSESRGSFASLKLRMFFSPIDWRKRATRLLYVRMRRLTIGAQDAILPHGIGGVIGAADQRAGFHVGEAHFVTGAAEVFEFGGGDVAHDGQVLGRGAQVLADGEDVDTVGAKIAHHVQHFVDGLAEAQHEPRFYRRLRRYPLRVACG